MSMTKNASASTTNKENSVTEDGNLNAKMIILFKYT